MRFKPGESVPRSGVYRVYHDEHRLMHEATLLTRHPFPCCRRCSHQVRFELVRPMRDVEVMPFRSGEILAEYAPRKRPKAG